VCEKFGLIVLLDPLGKGGFILPVVLITLTLFGGRPARTDSVLLTHRSKGLFCDLSSLDDFVFALEFENGIPPVLVWLLFL